MFLYKGTITEYEVVKSARLKAGLCHSLKEEVQPVQLRLALTSFMDFSSPGQWFDCFEREEVEGKKVTYYDLVGEYILGARLKKPELPKEGKIEAVTAQGSFELCLESKLQLTFLVPDLELTPKYRKKDGVQMRTAPPGWEGSRLLWRLSDAVLCCVEYAQLEEGVAVQSTPIEKTEEEEAPCPTLE